MSRGPGKAERFVLDYLEAAHRPRTAPWLCWEPVPELARAYADGATPTAAQAETIRRAVRSLTRKQMIEASAATGKGYVRLPLDDSGREREAKERDRRSKQVEAWMRGKADYPNQEPLRLPRPVQEGGTDG